MSGRKSQFRERDESMMIRGDGEIRSRENAMRLGRIVWLTAVLIGFIILLRVSALTEGTWALGALLFGAVAMGVLWNDLYRNDLYRSFFAQRNSAKVLAWVFILLFAAGALALCAIASAGELRLVLFVLLIAAQLFSVPMLERVENLSGKVRTVLLVVMHFVLDAVMLMATSSISSRAEARGCFAAYVISGAALIGCRNLPEDKGHTLAAEEKLPASFGLWLQTVGADVMTAVFCGIAFTSQVSLRVGTPAAVLLLLLGVMVGVIAAVSMWGSKTEYAVLQRRGIGCWLLAMLMGVLQSAAPLLAFFVLPLFGLGCAFIVCGLSAMREPFELLLSRHIEESEENRVEVYLGVAIKSALLPAGLMMLGALAVAVCFLPHNNRIVTPTLTLFSFAIGTVFLVRSWLLTTRQPMDRDSSAKIHRYADLFSPEKNPRLGARLNETLVEPYTRSAGFWLVKSAFRPFFPSKFVGSENIDSAADTPMVFVCNHLEIYGPIITQLHVPYPVRSWIINNMVDLELTEQNLSGAIDKIFRIFSLRFRRWLCHALAKPVCWAMNNIDHVTVYRGNSRDVIRTIRETVDAVQCGDNILLFPENTSAEGENGAYKIGEVSAFFSGFSNIASSVYEKTGQCITFYPLFADKKKKKIYAEKGITFDPSHSKPEEKKRIVTYLHDTMCKMAENAGRN